MIKIDLAKTVRFTPGISYNEDFLYLFQILRNDIKIQYFPKPMYFYTVSCQDSLVNTLTHKAFESDRYLLSIIEKIKSEYNDTFYNKRLEIFSSGVIMNRIFKYKHDVSGNEIKDFKKYSKSILKHPHHFILKKLLVLGALNINYSYFKRLIKF